MCFSLEVFEGLPYIQIMQNNSLYRKASKILRKLRDLPVSGNPLRSQDGATVRRLRALQNYKCDVDSRKKEVQS